MREIEDTSELTEAGFADLADGLAARGAREGRMFGMRCLKTAGGKAFAGIHGDGIVFKLGDVERADALGLPGATHFDPMGGRPMREWIVVPAAHADAWRRLGEAAMDVVEG